MPHFMWKPRGLCWVLLLAMILTMVPSTAFAAGNESAALSVSVTEIGETEATLTVTDRNAIADTKFAIYKVQEKNEPAPTPEDVESFTLIEDTDFTSGDEITTTTKLSSLQAGTAYTVYAMIAYFDEGGAAYTEIVSAEFTTKKAAPLSVSVTGIGETEAALTVTDHNAISGTKFAIYKVQEKDEPAPTLEDVEAFTLIEDTDFTSGGEITTTTKLSSLQAGTAYTVYAMIAYFDEGGAAYTEIVSAEFTTKDGSGGGDDPGGDEGDAMSLSYRTASGAEFTTVKYADYAEAVAAMNALGESCVDVTLKLLSDINITLTQDWERAITINRTCALDLNGKILGITGKGYVSVYGIYVEGDLTFTLTDSSEEKSGELRCRSAYDITAICVGSNRVPRPEGAECDVRFVMNAGTVTAKNPDTGTGQDAVFLADFGEAEMNAGRVEGYVSALGTFTMNGGEMEAAGPVGVVILKETSRFCMTGGSIRNTDTATSITEQVAAVSVYTVLNKNDAIRISGGSLSSVNGPALYLAHGPQKSAGVSITGEAVLRSEHGAAIAFHCDIAASASDKFNLSIGNGVALEGADRVVDLIFAGDAHGYLTVNMEDGVTLRCREGTLPIAPNSAYVTYPEGMVLDVTPVKSELVDGVTYGTYGLAKTSELGQKVGTVDWGYQYFDDLSTALNGAKSIYNAGNDAGVYDSSLWTAFAAAYEAALPILQNANANQKEIDYFTDALGVAQSAMIADAERNVDLSNLPDGTYTVDVEMWNFSFDRLSMANGAVNSKAQLEVKDGAASITIGFKPILQIGYWGSLMQYWAYDGNTPSDGYRNATVHSGDEQYMKEADYPAWQNVNFTNGTATPIEGEPLELPKLTNEIRPASARITLPYIGNSNDYNKVYCYVGVDMMRSLDGSTVGDQPVLLYIKYSTLKATSVQATLSVDTSPIILLPEGTQEVSAKMTGDTGWEIHWSSDNTAVAAVSSEDGKATIKGIGNGETTIQVTATKQGETPIGKSISVTVKGGTPLKPAVTDSGSTATVEITGNTLVTNQTGVDVASDAVTIDAGSGKNVSKTDVTFSAEAVSALKEAGREVVVETGAGAIRLDAALVSAAASGGQTVNLTMEKVAVPTLGDEDIKRSEFESAYELKLTSGGAAVSFRNGKATVVVPWSGRYGYAYYVDGGALKNVQTMVVINGTASWTTDHFSTWALSEKGTLKDKVGATGGVYSVPIRIKQANQPSADSMANDATGNMVIADVAKGGVTYTMFLRARVGTELGGEPLRGHLLKMWYYDPDDTGLDNPISARVVQTYQDKDMHGKIDTFPRAVEIHQKGAPQSRYYIQVYVDAMGTNYQNAIVQLDWSKALNDGGKAAREGFEDKLVQSRSSIKSGETITRANLKKWMDEGTALLVEGKAGGLTVRFDTDAMEAIYNDTKSSVKIILEERSGAKLSDKQKEVVGDRPAYELKIVSGDDTVSGIDDGEVELTFPYTLKKDENQDGLVICLLSENGSVKKIKCVYSEGSKELSFGTREFGVFAIGYDESRIWANPFTDVKEEDWFHEAVKYVVQKKLFSGTGETAFSPHANMTREMLVTVLYRLAASPKVEDTSKFRDVPAGQYYTDAVIWATENGIVSGYSDGWFGTENDVTREQMTAILYRYAKFKGYDVGTVKSLDGFMDRDTVASYALRPMQWAYGNDIITGTGAAALSPKANATRAQVAAILMRFDEKTVASGEAAKEQAAKNTDQS